MTRHVHGGLKWIFTPHTKCFQIQGLLTQVTFWLSEFQNAMLKYDANRCDGFNSQFPLEVILLLLYIYISNLSTHTNTFRNGWKMLTWAFQLTDHPISHKTLLSNASRIRTNTRSHMCGLRTRWNYYLRLHLKTKCLLGSIRHFFLYTRLDKQCKLAVLVTYTQQKHHIRC